VWRCGCPPVILKKRYEDRSKFQTCRQSHGVSCVISQGNWLAMAVRAPQLREQSLPPRRERPSEITQRLISSSAPEPCVFGRNLAAAGQFQEHVVRYSQPQSAPAAKACSLQNWRGLLAWTAIWEWSVPMIGQNLSAVNVYFR